MPRGQQLLYGEKMTVPKHPAVVLGLFETGLGVARSLGRAGITVLGLDHTKQIGFHSRYVRPFICPHPLAAEKEFIAFLLNIARQQEAQPVLFITADEFMISVSRNRSRIQDCYLLNIPDSDIIESITAKFRQYECASKAGMCVPKTFLATTRDEISPIAASLSFPVFIKAQDVSSWRKTFGPTLKGFLATSEEDLRDKLGMILDNGTQALAQEVIPGPDTNHFKVCCYVSKEGEILLAFTLQKVRQQPAHFGVGCVVQSVQYPALMDLGMRFFKGIAYRGIGSAEFKLDTRDGRLKLIELNARYWQQNALAEKCGMNFPMINYLDLVGYKPGAICDFREGIKWINIYRDYESFRTYKHEGKLTLADWLRSLRGPKVFSDYAYDDILPGLYEVRFGKRIITLPKYAMGKIRQRLSQTKSVQR